jgi:hypothetical protein
VIAVILSFIMSGKNRREACQGRCGITLGRCVIVCPRSELSLHLISDRLPCLRCLLC